MSDLQKRMWEALQIAEGVMDYCAGDSWEREATADDRTKFAEAMQAFRKELETPEQRAAREKAHQAYNEATLSVTYWHRQTFYCPVCKAEAGNDRDKLRKVKHTSRAGLVQHYRDMHGITYFMPGRWRWQIVGERLDRDLGEPHIPVQRVPRYVCNDTLPPAPEGYNE